MCVAVLQCLHLDDLRRDTDSRLCSLITSALSIGTIGQLNCQLAEGASRSFNFRASRASVSSSQSQTCILLYFLIQ